MRTGKLFGTKTLAGLILGAFFAQASAANGTVIWNESINGNLSTNQASPTSFVLGLGTSSVIGNVNDPAGNSQDWVEVHVPTGDFLTGYILAAYSSTDNQGFTGVQAGTSFVGSAFSAGSYLGYSHYGTGATNGSLPATNLIGVNLLPLMGDNVNISPGSAGFTAPLPSGDYTFLIQQLGASTNYQFDFVTVPEPGTSSILAAGMAILAFCGRRLVRRSDHLMPLSN